MEENKIKELVAELDSLIPKDGALCKIDNIPKPHRMLIEGNKNGLLRLGIEILKISFSLEENEKKLDVPEFDYLEAEPFKKIAFFRNDEITKRSEEDIINFKKEPSILGKILAFAL